MSRSAKYRAPFGDGIYTFVMDISALEELQESVDAGPEEIYELVVAGRWRTHHLREPIRIGLVRGGVDPMKALALVGRYAVPPYLIDLKPLVTNILGAGLLGAPDEDAPSGEQKAGEKDPSPAAKSASATSTPPARKSGSRRKKSDAAPSGS